jgi:hypothetical protein
MPEQASPAPPRWERLARWLVPVVFAGWIVQAWLNKEPYDLEVFRLAGARVLHGEALYRLSDGAMPFKYAPPVALLLVPLAGVPLRAAYLCWLLLSAAALFRVVTWSQRVLGGVPDGRRELLVVLLCTPFVIHLFYLGQCDALLLLLAVQSEAVRRRAPVGSGLLLALAVLVKPPFLLFGLLAGVRREGRRLAGLGAGLVVASALTVAAFGPAWAAAETAAWRTLLAETTPGSLCGIANQSLAALVCTYLGQQPRTVGFPVAVGVVALGLGSVLVWAVRRVSRGNAVLADALAVAMTFYGTALLSPLGWRTNLLALIPALALLLSPVPPPLDRPARAWRMVSVGAMAATALLLNYDVLGLARFQRLQGLRMYGLLGLLVAAATTVVTLRRARPPQAIAAPVSASG